MQTRLDVICIARDIQVNHIERLMASRDAVGAIYFDCLAHAPSKYVSDQTFLEKEVLILLNV